MSEPARPLHLPAEQVVATSGEPVLPNLTVVTTPEQPADRKERIRRLAAQSVVRLTHAFDMVTAGPAVYFSNSEKTRRNSERTAVGLKPKN